ncbi:MAG: hypothetical protein RR420_00975 [Anaerovoracaceae bacterium]
MNKKIKELKEKITSKKTMELFIERCVIAAAATAVSTLCMKAIYASSKKDAYKAGYRKGMLEGPLDILFDEDDENEED